ncbi:MAG: hypothetical protein V2B19_24490 [Pseudomonadota bacterium]
MTGLLIFNHHCLPFDDVNKADAAVPVFLRICLKVQNMGISTILVDESVDKNWFRLELANRYFWQDWYRKNQKDEARDMIRAFRSITTRQQFFSMEDNGIGIFEVFLDGNSSYSALRAAAWHEAPLSGFPTRPPWNRSPITVQVQTLDSEGEISTQNLDLMNFHSLGTLEQDLNALCEKRNELIRSGRDLYDMRDRIFPHLVFCGRAPQQLRSWSAGKTVLDQVKESLTVLNKFCGMWSEGRYRDYSHEAVRSLGLSHRTSDESGTVLNHPGLRSEREFWLPEGRKAVFEKHVKLGNGYRLHFFPDNSSQKIYVGHIGPHLSLK